MAHDDDSQALDRAYQPSPGLGVAVSDPVQNPGLPPHRERMTDKDPRAEKAAVRTVYTLFYLSLAGSIWAVAAYMLFPIESGALIDIRQNNLFIGLGIALALLALGIERGRAFAQSHPAILEAHFVDAAGKVHSA